MSEKVWFITGASRGFGLEFARAALEAGDKVVATSRIAAAINKVIQPSENLLTCSVDVTNKETSQSAVSAALDKFGRIDILINNAGYALIGALEECSPEEVETQYRTNVFGLLDVIRAVLPSMRNKRSGHIINLSSTAGLRGSAGASSYCGSKFAVEGLSESLAQELNPLGIRVTIVEPGYFRTDFLNGNSLRLADREIPDYAETSGTIRKVIPNANGKQEGDPRKLALALLQLVDENDPPLHFVAGNDAVKVIDSKIETLQKEVNRWRALSTALAHD